MQTTLHTGPTLGVGVLHGVLVIAHPACAPNQGDWDELCAAIRAQRARVRGQLVLTLGGAPNAAQRRRALAELPKNFVPPPVAVLTESLAVRGIITALNWCLNDNHRAFAPGDAASVAAHLHVSPSEAHGLIAFASALLPRTP